MWEQDYNVPSEIWNFVYVATRRGYVRNPKSYMFQFIVGTSGNDRNYFVNVPATCVMFLYRYVKPTITKNNLFPVLKQ